ncbi:hypothetical protein CK203_102867 [Vitis vinifera]|uniref:Uncharacterized protein n=1 Tax=Vitis vinifera TaxID=29760 RepID=A0A438C5I9_VITVI|nr:hypothetical protein CK203_102867 [Vitis vinifera]
MLSGILWRKLTGGSSPGNYDWKADIEMLQLEQLNQQEAENLEHPFSEEEIHSALMEMNGTKPRTG